MSLNPATALKINVLFYVFKCWRCFYSLNNESFYNFIRNSHKLNSQFSLLLIILSIKTHKIQSATESGDALLPYYSKNSSGVICDTTTTEGDLQTGTGEDSSLLRIFTPRHISPQNLDFRSS